MFNLVGPFSKIFSCLFLFSSFSFSFFGFLSLSLFLPLFCVGLARFGFMLNVYIPILVFLFCLYICIGLVFSSVLYFLWKGALFLWERCK